MRWMGLDIGDKTVGVAVSDPLFLFAQGVATIERVGIRKDTGRVVELMKEYEVSKVICGLPIKLSGEDSPQTQKVREFVKLLSNKCRSLGLNIDIEFQDERFTSKIAEQVLVESGVRRENRKTYIDKMAAQIILQSYMDSHARR